MDVRATTEAPAGTGADTIAVGLFEDEGIAHDSPDGALGALVEAGEAKAAFRKLALTHDDGKRWLVAGLGKRDEFDPERARIVARRRDRPRPRARRALAVLGAPPPRLRRARRRVRRGQRDGRLRLHAVQVQAATTTTTGDGVAELIVSAHHDVAGPVETGRDRRRVGQPQRATSRTAPPTTSRRPRWPSAPREIAGNHDTLTLEVMGRVEIEAAGMGAFAGVAQGTRGGAAADHAPLRRPGRDRPGARLRRQGRDVRLRRHLAQARQQDERHEVRHVGRRGRAGRHRGDRAARAAGPAHLA